jgi:Flp pilus assembly protein TadD
MVRRVPILCVAGVVAACGAAEPDPDRAGAVITAENLFDRGRQYAASGDLLRAEQYFTTAIEAGYDDDEVFPHLLDACIRSARFHSALSYAQPRLQNHPNDWRLRTVVASLHIATGNPSSAVRELERVVEQQPEAPLAHYLLAVVHRDEGGAPEEAKVHFERYLALAPDGEHAEEARAFVTGPSLPTRVPSTETGGR